MIPTISDSQHKGVMRSSGYNRNKHRRETLSVLMGESVTGDGISQVSVTLGKVSVRTKVYSMRKIVFMANASVCNFKAVTTDRYGACAP